MKVRNLTPRARIPNISPLSKSELDPEVSGLLVAHVRNLRRWSKKKLAAQLGVVEATVRRWEKGYPLPRKTVERLAAVAQLPMSHVDGALIPAFEASVREAGDTLAEPAQEPAIEEDLAPVLAGSLGPPLAAFEETLTERCPERAKAPSAADRESVPALAATFLPANAGKRALLVERLDPYKTWAFAEWLAHQSAVAAARDAQEALRLALLAVRAAKLATAKEEGPWRLRLLGYVWPFVANAYRVGNDFDAADAAMKNGNAMWKNGDSGDPQCLLAEWRRLDLEACLRRDEQLFTQALDLHRRAMAVANRAEASRILLSKAYTFEQMGDFERALATLQEAVPQIDPQREPRNHFGLSYNMGICLCRLGRAREAAGLLPEVRSLAAILDNDLDLLRVRWLEGRVDAGLGKVEQARTAFEQVRSEFDSLNLPYDYALATLDLALLCREQQRWPEIRGLAEEMIAIFEKHGIHREAWAAVALLREAAVKEAVTVELLRRLESYLKQAHRRPGLKFEPVGVGRQKG